MSKFKTRLSEVALVPASGGAFEVVVGDEKIHSKLESGVYPVERDLLKQMDAMV